MIQFLSFSMLRKIYGPFKEFGLVAGSLYAVDRVLHGVSRSWRLQFYELMVQPITDEPLISPRLSSRHAIREIHPGDPHLSSMPVRPEIMAARLQQNAICLGAFKGQELVGYVWFARDQYEEDEVRCTYTLARPEQSVFDFDFYVYPPHRMGLAFVTLWDGARAFLHRSGIQYTFSRMTRFNEASRRAHRRLGGQVVGQALFLKLGQVQLMFGTIAPFCALSVSAAHRTRITLRPRES
jgi:hypothetical protein